VSASEKLRALERRIEEHGSPDNDLHGEELLLALPQIVAVVEAAETIRDRSLVAGSWDEETLKRIKAEHDHLYYEVLPDALAALEEALQ